MVTDVNMYKQRRLSVGFNHFSVARVTIYSCILKINRAERTQWLHLQNDQHLVAEGSPVFEMGSSCSSQANVAETQTRPLEGPQAAGKNQPETALPQTANKDQIIKPAQNDITEPGNTQGHSNQTEELNQGKMFYFLLLRVTMWYH